MQSRLSHQRKESERLYRNRLTTGVRTGDDERAVFAAELDCDRHDLALVKQRVARTNQVHLAVAGDSRRRAVHAEGQLAFGEDEREQRDVVVIKLNRSR